uniref:Reverse transcriptase domain-containing protein n=1 Tax=Tanacetum cinerariifolium TaxID=118510 RepID=A0A6L2KAF3_TANCI|nr:hypothetical protein [Tanacetum cinerariifolium]
MVKGGLCLTCDFREKNLSNCDPNAYSFDNSNYFPRTQYENHLCNLCGNNSHDGYDCQQQFSFIHDKEPSYNQNYDGNYFSHESSSLLCCDNYEGSHETFQCQPITFQISFFGSDQIQTPQYPEIHLSSQETSDEVFQANHSIQNVESSNEIVVSNSNQEKEEPSQESDIHQLIEECSIEVCEEQKQRYEHLSITLETESDEVTESNAENLLPIPSKCEVEASLPDPEIVSLEEENVVQQEEEEVDLEDISQIQDIVLREKLLSITRLISNIEYLNDNSTPDRVLNSFESDNSLLDNFSPEFETFCDHSEETRSSNTTHADNTLPEYDSFCFEIEPDQERLINLVKNNIFDDLLSDSLLDEADLFLSDNSIPPGIENVADDPEEDIRFLEELLIDDYILSHESFNSNFEDNPLIPRPPPEPPVVKTDAGEEIPVVMINKDRFDDDYHFFMFDK